MRFATIAALSLAFLTTPVSAGETKGDEENAETEAKADKKICKRVRTMGSNRRERLCMTREEWQIYNKPKMDD